MLRLIVLLCLLLAPLSAQAERRVAFLVGNSDYANAPALDNPVNDVRLLSATLADLGFDVTAHLNLTRDGFSAAFSAFLEAEGDADVTFFYYAGHGMQYEGENYLIATDAVLRTALDVESETIPLTRVIALLEKRSKAALVFIDACRDNPLAERFYAEVEPATRGAGTRGLALVTDTYEGAMLVFAAAPGQVALDGAGGNSPFSEALARHLPASDVEVLSLMKRVIRDVRAQTSGFQTPMVMNDLTREIFLAPRVASPAPDPEARARAEWPDFRDSTSVETLTAFAERHAGTSYARLAADRAAAMAAAPPAAPAIPEECRSARTDAERAVCIDPALRDLDAEVRKRTEAQMAVVVGAMRGTAFIELRDWQLGRDACGTDPACLRRSYELRLLALSEYSDAPPSTPFVVRSAQEELNRLSCGAGPPDGEPGRRTATAIAALAAATGTEKVVWDVTQPKTLARMRGLPGGICSVLRRAVGTPDALAGSWDMIAYCPPDSGWPNQTLEYRMTLTPRESGGYTGKLVRENGSSAVLGATLSSAGLGVSLAWPSGARSSLSLEHGADPNSLHGMDSYKCTLTGSKR